MADDNVTAIHAPPAEPSRKPRKAKPAPSIDDMEQAINKLHLVKDWAMYQAMRENTTDEKSVCAVMDLLYHACDVLNGALEATQASGRMS